MENEIVMSGSIECLSGSDIINNNFYVYVYLDQRKPGKYKYGEYEFDYEPFYVGKGSNGRYIKHLRDAYTYKDLKYHKCNIYKCNIIRKIKEVTGNDPIIIKYKENLMERQSFDLEIDMINILGKKSNGGILTNVIDGGDGNSGEKNPMWKHKHTEKSKKLMRDNHADFSGKNHPQFGTKHSKERIEENRLSNIGKQVGKNHPMWKYYYKFTSIEGIEYKNITNLREFCKENTLNYWSIVNSLRSGRKKYLGWSIDRSETIF
jgi:hypothetical protein